MSSLHIDRSDQFAELRTEKVSNNYFDEIVALSASETEDFPTPTEQRTEDGDDLSQSRSMERGNARGDSPPSNLSQSDEDYDDEEEEDDVESEVEPEPAVPRRSHTGRPSAAPAGRGGLGATTNAANILGPDFDDDLSGHDALGHSTGLGAFPRSSAGAGSTSPPQEGSTASDELTELFQYISRYKPQETDLDTELKPFIPDYVPAIGDIDAFIKIPRPDKKPDLLGLTFLDEPSAEQSDPTVLDLRLRALTKSSAATPVTIRSIESPTQNPKAVDTWIKNIRDLHAQKPPQMVNYTTRMPDIEDLMQVWPAEFEEALGQINLPPAELDAPLSQYAELLSLLLDIPVAGPPAKNAPAHARIPAAPGGKPSSTHVVEALHVMFSLYAEFNSSAHFKALERSVGS